MNEEEEYIMICPQCDMGVSSCMCEELELKSKEKNED